MTMSKQVSYQILLPLKQVEYPYYRPREIMYLVASVCPSVRYQGLGLPSAAKANYPQIWREGHYQSIDYVSVSVIRGRMRIISRMRSIGF